MKQKLVQGVRKLLPTGAVRAVEEIYRRGRVYAVSAYYGNPARSLRVIAVTGTNGKTTTANYINEILKQTGYKTAMFSTAVIEINGNAKVNDINVTVATTGLMQRFFRAAKKAQVDYVVLEITSHSLHQHKLDTVPIEVAVMTNLTQDHLDYHLTMDDYAAAKSKLFSKLPQYMVLNRDDDWFDFFNKFDAAHQKITYGTHKDAEARIDHVKLYKKCSEARIVFDGNIDLELATALPGQFNVYNMTAAASVAYLLGIKLDDIMEGAANLEAVPGRMERIETGAAYDVIVDYAHTPDALEKLLEASKAVTKNRIVLVFGAAGDRDKSKRPIMGEIASRLADRIILTDEENYTEDAAGIRAQIYEGIEAAKGDAKTTEIADRREAIRKALSVAKTGDTVIVAGLGHEQYRIIDGERVAWHDPAVIRELLDESTKKNQ